MKLSLKIIGLFILLLLLTLAVDGLLTVYHELVLIRERLKDETLSFGYVIGDLIELELTERDLTRALEIINEVNRIEDREHLSLLPIAAAYSDSDLTDENIKRLLSGSGVYTINKKERLLITSVPIFYNNDILAYLKIYQTFSFYNHYRRQILFKDVFLSLSLTVAGVVLSIIIGRKYVKHPLDILIRRTERISRGDFSESHDLKTKDELLQLENAVNLMCEKLNFTMESLKSETEKRIDSLEQLRHSERLSSLGRLSSGFAHEMGTPLNIIRGRAQLIIREDLTGEEIREYAGIILSESDRMTDIIRKLLNYARRSKSNFRAAEILPVIRTAAALLKPLCDKKNIIVNINSRGEIPLLNIDEQQMQQVFLNLIMNAEESMEHPGTIDISVFPPDPQL